MKLQDVAKVTNDVIKQLGGSVPLMELDLTNVVDVGKALEDENKTDSFFNALYLKISNTIFEVEPYIPSGINIKKESSEWRAIVEKIRFEAIDVTTDPRFEVEAGEALPLPKYMPPKAKAVHYVNRLSAYLEVTMPYKNGQSKMYLRSAEDWFKLVTAINELIHEAVSAFLDMVTVSTLARFTADTLASDKKHVKVKLVTEFNRIYTPDTPLTAEKALHNPNFLQYAIGRIDEIFSDMRYTTTNFNLEGRRTSMKGRENLVVLKSFESKIQTLLLPDVYHNTLLKLPGYQTVPVWQAYGELNDFNSRSAIKIKVDEQVHNFKNIIGVAYDTDAMGVVNEEIDARESVNGPTGYVNRHYNLGVGNYNDHGKNFVVFTLD